MKRSGFTMIELIFVIVILGILASVAIPKLAATRDDAKISKAASEVSTLVSDLGAYYTGHGTFGKLSDMTNVKLTTSDGKTDWADANMTGNANKAYYSDKATGTTCISFYESAADGNLTISSESNATAFCKGVNQAIKDLVKVHQFGGSSVSFN